LTCEHLLRLASGPENRHLLVIDLAGSFGTLAFSLALFTEVRGIGILGSSQETKEAAATVELLTTTLKLVVRHGVRVLDLASGGLQCSLVGLRAGRYMQPLGFLEGEKRFPRLCMVVPPSEVFYSQTMASRECVCAKPL
jgi:hypothetical protein